MQTVTLSQPRRFTILVAVPLAVFTLAYVLSPVYGKQPVRLSVLPGLFLIEVFLVGLPAMAILDLVQRLALFAIAAIAQTAAAAFGVWAATSLNIQDGQGGFAFMTPTYVGLIAAVVLGGVDELITLLENKPD